MVSLEDDEQNAYFNLTIKQRIIGFAVTAGLGLFSGILSIFAITLLRIRKFSLLFAICNLMILSSTGFVVGFKRQFKSLTDPKRVYSAIGMLVGMVTTFLFAMKWKYLVGVLIGFLIEVISFAYYALSYLPMGTTLFHKCFF
ncbi:Vesicle transport protein SFT2B [Tritrichomonas foetus]|uniref:Vesicle transport protein n=1 Tax=Tritrichomonas foetus TaxID=1144522 RepID=A0A1J4KN84_9EUKA|nr:Vesicle transport protein SFT2B [Tritrichomonas foetus]|eukprot:OHT12578.1 Vesicle transport protein SFT2B [Tritrichomonas foetus]